MRSLSRLVLVTALFLALSSCANIHTPWESQRIQITECDDSFTLTVPVSHLTMTIPAEGFTVDRGSRVGSATSPRYFIFRDKHKALSASGWFEWAGRFKGIETHWKKDTAAWAKTGTPSPQNVIFQKINGWSVVLYDIHLGPDVSNSHIRAEWTQSDTWIDLHVSITSVATSDECRRELIALLSRIDIREKK